MRPPPPLTRFVHYPITAGVGLAAIFVMVLRLAGHTIDPLVMSVLAFEGEPWRIPGSALPHADFLHLAFNLMWLWIFGTVVEGVWGPARTAAIFVLFACGSSLAEYAVLYGGIGLSGVGYGLFGLMWVLARRDPRFVGVVDVRTVRLFVAWFFLCIVLTVTGIMNVGNIAHGAGAVMGVFLGYAIASARAVARLASGAGLVVIVVAGMLGSTTYRPLVNVSRYGGTDSAMLGEELLDGFWDIAAIRHFQRAVDVNDDDDASWYNLGVVLENHRLQPDRALRAYRRAYGLVDNELHRGALARALIRRGVARAKAGDDAGAIELYRAGVAVEPTEMSGWWNLSLAFAATEQWDAAVDAGRKAFAIDATANTVLASALDGAGAMARSRMERDRAVAMFSEAAALDPSPRRYAVLAALYEELGRLEEAKAARAKVFEVPVELDLETGDEADGETDHP